MLKVFQILWFALSTLIMIIIFCQKKKILLWELSLKMVSNLVKREKSIKIHFELWGKRLDQQRRACPVSRVAKRQKYESCETTDQQVCVGFSLLCLFLLEQAGKPKHSRNRFHIKRLPENKTWTGAKRMVSVQKICDI